MPASELSPNDQSDSEDERTSGDPGEPTLAAAWQAPANLLENHATTKEREVENI